MGEKCSWRDGTENGRWTKSCEGGAIKLVLDEPEAGQNFDKQPLLVLVKRGREVRSALREVGRVIAVFPCPDALG